MGNESNDLTTTTSPSQPMKTVEQAHRHSLFFLTSIIALTTLCVPFWICNTSEYRTSRRTSLSIEKHDLISEFRKHLLKERAMLISRSTTPSTASPAGNFRNLTATQILGEVGLVDAQMRSNTNASVPPEAIFSQAQHEIVIAALAASRTLDIQNGSIRAALDRGVAVRVLLIDPTPSVISELSKRDFLPVAEEIRTVGDIITQHNLWNHPFFELRVRNYVPPFTGILIDGNINTRHATIQSNTILRIQPLMQFHNPRVGPVLQFASTPDKDRSAIILFAEDLRIQWQLARIVKSESDLISSTSAPPKSP